MAGQPDTGKIKYQRQPRSFRCEGSIRRPPFSSLGKRLRLKRFFGELNSSGAARTAPFIQIRKRNQAPRTRPGIVPLWRDSRTLARSGINASQEASGVKAVPAGRLFLP
ncbi:hypothetical protein [Eubacterium limosum]|uniref:hypothetical protein n=1 Tax=Eubacterium limosum TaxID=1736 RepID=UPI0010645438|nr:hypothetical protein [Eubacterium limosum]